MSQSLASSEPAPYSEDAQIIKQRELIDFGKRITVDEAIHGIVDIGRPIRVLAAGVYDMFHYGHANQMRQIKLRLPNSYLIVGLNSDEDTSVNKGKLVQTLDERADMVRHCRYVDEVYKGTPYIESIEFLDSMKIDFVAHDALPYVVGDVADIYAQHKMAGRFLETKRTDGISTTDAVCRILRDYETFVKKNMRKGYTLEELNVGFFMGVFHKKIPVPCRTGYHYSKAIFQSNKIKAQDKYGSAKIRGREIFDDLKSRSDEYFQNVNESIRPHRLRAHDKIETIKNRGCNIYTNVKFKVETMWNKQANQNNQEC